MNCGVDLMLNNLLIEKAVLGGLLQFDLSEELLNLSETDFYFKDSKELLEILQVTFSEHNKVDFTLASKRLQQADLLSFATQCVQSISVESQFSHYIKELKDLSERRRICEAANAIAKLAVNFDLTSDEVVGQAEAIMLDKNNTISSLGKLSELVIKEVEAIEKRASGEIEIAVPTGFPGYDKQNFGFRGSELVVIGARPSVGKTALAIRLACNIAKLKAVPFFSLEMNRHHITQRVLSSEGNIPLSEIITGKISELNLPRMASIIGESSKIKLQIDDKSGITVEEIAAKCRRIKRETDIGAVIIDYLQLMQGKGETREREVANNSRALKRLAMELNCPIVVLSQLNRAVESRKNKKPTLADLRESGAIEQDADVVWLLDREIDPRQGDITKATINVAKCRNGKVGGFDLRYQPLTVKFYGG